MSDKRKKKNSVISDQNKVNAQMCYCLLIHSSVVFGISINCSAMGVGGWGVESGCPSMLVLQGQVSGTDTKLARQQGTLFFGFGGGGGGWGQLIHVHTGNLAACTRSKTASFSTAWIFQKQLLGGRQTAWCSPALAACSVRRQRLAAGGTRERFSASLDRTRLWLFPHHVLRT